jgi:hypothetical protein
MSKDKKKTQPEEDVKGEEDERIMRSMNVLAPAGGEYPTIDVDEIEGVGNVTAQKLRVAGYSTVRDVAFASVKELADIVGSEDRARQIIMAAQKLIGLQAVHNGLRALPEEEGDQAG